MTGKNAFSCLAERNGHKYYKLICKDHYLCDFFDHWSYQLSCKQAFKTVKAYSEGVLAFINYLFEAEKILGPLDVYGLHDVLESFESYLVFGSNSESDLAKEISKRLKDELTVGASTVSVYFTGLNNFLEKSENLRSTLLSLQLRGVKTAINPTDVPLSLYETIDTPDNIKKAVKESSWMSGCISGGMRQIKKKHLAPSVPKSTVIFTDEYGGDEKTFPIDLAKELIDSAPNLRDKVLWSLIAASGCRISEAQTMLKRDIKIDISNIGNEITVIKKIYIVDPETRREELSRFLTETEINSLPHKGRTPPDTYLIEPFASIFWKTYDEYLQDEIKKSKKRGLNVDHGFLIRLVPTGEPAIDSYQTLYDTFSAAAKALTGSKYGFHSLRHMYGYYLKNFCPRGNGKFGMELKEVQKYMGHANPSSTDRYARDDAIKLSAAMGAMNMYRNRMPNFNIRDAKIEYLESEIERLKLEASQVSQIGEED